jgi:hypothetical protein
MENNLIVFTENELNEAKRQTVSMINKLEKCVPKIKIGTAQHTLALRRLAALKVSLMLIERELNAL